MGIFEKLGVVKITKCILGKVWLGQIGLPTENIFQK